MDYAAIKRNKIVPLVETWMDLETAVEHEVSQKKLISYIKAYICNLEKWYR